jgi:cytokinesis protein
MKKRKQAFEERAARLREAVAAGQLEDDGALERLIESLNNGTVAVKGRHRQRPADLNAPVPDPNDSTFNAKDMLAQLQTDGFIVPPSPTVAPSIHQRRRRRWTERGFDDEMEAFTSEVSEMPEDSDSEVVDTRFGDEVLDETVDSVEDIVSYMNY